METNPIVPEFDVPRNILSRLPSCRVSRPVNALNFKGGIERFRQAIVEAYSRAADGLADPQPFQDRGELARSIIAAAVGMKDGIGGEIEVAGSHLDRRGYQRSPVIVIHCPADYLACRAVDDGGEKKPSFPGRDISYV